MRPENAVARLLAWWPLAGIGLFSYSLYLIHEPLLQVVWQYVVHPLHLGRGMTFAVLVLISTPVIIGLSYAFFLAFEKPFLPKKISVKTDLAQVTPI